MVVGCGCEEGGAATAETGSLNVTSDGNATALVGLNYLGNNETMALDGNQTPRLAVDFFKGRNVVFILQTSGRPFIDAVVVS